MMDENLETSELIAYLDGELPIERRGDIERRIAGDAQLRRRLRSLQALTKHTKAAIRGATPAPSDDLRSRIAMIAAGPDATTSLPSPHQSPAVAEPAPRAWARRLAIAASIALCCGLGIWFAARSTGVSPEPPQARQILQGRAASGLSVETVALIEARHIKCVMMGNNFEDPTFPRVLAEVGPAVRQYLGDDVAIPDLSSIDLTFAGVGPCDLTGGKTLHWLYLGKDPAATPVSVFVQPFAGQVSFGVDQAVVIAGPTAEYPLLVWRTDKFVYYLTGDDFSTTSQAAEKLDVSFGL